MIRADSLASIARVWPGLADGLPRNRLPIMHGFTDVDRQSDPNSWVAVLGRLSEEPFYQAFQQRVRELLHPAPRCHYLEVGAGTGASAAKLKDDHGRSSRPRLRHSGARRCCHSRPVHVRGHVLPDTASEADRPRRWRAACIQHKGMAQNLNVFKNEWAGTWLLLGLVGSVLLRGTLWVLTVLNLGPLLGPVHLLLIPAVGRTVGTGVWLGDIVASFLFAVATGVACEGLRGDRTWAYRLGQGLVLQRHLASALGVARVRGRPPR
ncbi:hypothetical protein [Micromonospora fulviviridis]|uniref:Class I SAM-dependent methyltransferase n=1 Tax=Micromonospora fulviviridis TaxID=47860 RepID=A0ABV2VET2_9ACTN